MSMLKGLLELPAQAVDAAADLVASSNTTNCPCAWLGQMFGLFGAQFLGKKERTSAIVPPPTPPSATYSPGRRRHRAPDE